MSEKVETKASLCTREPMAFMGVFKIFQGGEANG